MDVALDVAAVVDGSSTDVPAGWDCCVVVDELPPDEVAVVVDATSPPLEDTLLVGEVWAVVAALSDEPDEAGKPAAVRVVSVLGMLPVDALSARLDDALEELPFALTPDEPFEVAGSACASPVPLTSAAPTPNVTAPAPSHRNGWV